MASVVDDHSPQSARATSQPRRNEKTRVWRPENLSGVELLHGSYRSFSFARHFHSVAAIGFVEHGTMSCYWQGRDYDVPADTAILFNAGDVHAPYSRAGQPWSFRMLYLDSDLISEILGHDGNFLHTFVPNPDLKRAISQAHAQLDSSMGAMAAEVAFACLQPLLSAYTTRQTKFSRPRNTRMQRAEQFIRARYRDDISLRQLAAEVQLSPFHFLRSFREQFGIPPHAYLLQIRVEEAQRMLRAGHDPASVAAQTGFVDQSHLTRHFKRITGTTPGQYR